MVVAVEESRGKLCRTFPQNTTFPEGFPSENASSMGVCVLVRPEMTQPEQHNRIVSFEFSETSVVAGKM